ncbi:MAG: MFS transporter [Acidimicrobiales bacterium]|nr:MFS transporter [Acidimicrobiales bacterium]
MIAMPVPEEKGPWWPRFTNAALHPVQWLRTTTGNGPLYALLVLFGLNMVDEFDRTGFAVLLPNIRTDFGLSNSQLLTIIAVVGFFALGLSVPLAMLADRSNRVRLMTVGFAIFTIFSAFTGLIPTVWWALLLVRLGTGLGQATSLPTHNSLLADYFDIPYRPGVYSFHRAANAVGAIVGPIAFGLLGQAFGWRVPFLVMAIPCAVFVVLSLAMREPKRGRWERKAMGASDEVVELDEEPPSFEEAWRLVMRVHSMRRIFYALPFLASALIGFGVLANLLYEEVFGLDEAQRGLMEAASEPFQLVGIAVGAAVGMRLIRKGPAFVVRQVAVVSVIAAVGAAGFALAPNWGVALGFRIVISMTLAMVLPSVFAALSLGLPARARSSGFSIAALYIIPGLFMLPIIGALGDTFGIRVGMLIMTPIFVLGGVIIASSGKLLEQDIANVWTSMAARSELLYEARQGTLQQLLIRKLDVRYGDIQILFDVDVEINQGEIVALLGTNGAGKSTLLKAITGVVEAHAGAIIFEGRDITHAPPHEIAQFGIAMVPGGQGVFPTLSVAENLRIASWLDRKHKAEVARRVDEVLEMFPVLRERLDDPAANLSGGQQQMLALGMAFLSRPKLLAIDELSLGLAPVIVEQPLPIVRRIADQGTTVILVEQSVNVALTLAEKAFFMEKGEIRFSGPTAELLERPDVLRSVFLEGAAKGMGDGEAADAHAAADDGTTDAPPLGAGTPEAKAAAAASVRERFGIPPDAPPALALDDLSVRFGGIRAVDGVTFSVAAGEIVGIIGPNGAGKTTLFDLISGFTSSDGGTVALYGHDVTGLSADARARAGLGRSFQDARLFPALTVEETIATALDRWVDVKDPFNAAFRLPAFVDTEDLVQWRVDQLIDLLGLEAFRTKFVRELSTGSRRVVDLACVLGHHPSIVLLDEPSSGIAQRETEALGPLILKIRDTLGCAVVVIEHDMPLISTVSDRLVALDQGHVVTIGTPDEVLAHPEVVESYLGNTDAVIHRSGTGGDT